MDIADGSAGLRDRIRVNLGDGPIDSPGGFRRGDVNVDNLETTIGAVFDCNAARRANVQDSTSGCQMRYGFSGRIDDVRLYHGAIDDTEVQGLYAEGGWLERR